MTDAAPADSTGQRCGIVALIGTPNAGKSTLTNALVGQKVAIISPKVQTTRTTLTGIAIHGATQLLLVDTPGIFQPERRLDRAMVQTAWEGAADADILLLLVDASRELRADTWALIDSVGERTQTRWLVLNKTDIAARDQLLALARAINDRTAFQRTFMLSALSGDGVADLKAALGTQMPAGPWLFPADQLSDAPARVMATELVREQLFLQLEQELPYQSAVHCEKFRENADGSASIHAQIYVARDSQKAIVVGAGGRRIKSIGQRARQQIAEMLGRPVHLFLHVKVRPNWADDPQSWQDIGLRWVE